MQFSSHQELTTDQTQGRKSDTVSVPFVNLVRLSGLATKHAKMMFALGFYFDGYRCEYYYYAKICYNAVHLGGTCGFRPLA